MDKSTIISTIHHFLVEDFEIDESTLTPEADLKQTLDLDSLDYVDLVVSIESNFGFKVKPEDFSKMVTMSDFYDYVEQKVAEKTAA
ncbi:MAG: acyl carrier protein [Chitinophagaceae bacterium]|nr:acyl carrier protein [Chitinophagaceae bacterium]